VLWGLPGAPKCDPTKNREGGMRWPLTVTPIGANMRQLFIGFCKFVVISLILVGSAIQRHQNLAEVFRYNRSVLLLHTASHVDDVSRGSILCYENHNFC
jgi:hypothetical protein